MTQVEKIVDHYDGRVQEPQRAVTHISIEAYEREQQQKQKEPAPPKCPKCHEDMEFTMKFTKSWWYECCGLAARRTKGMQYYALVNTPTWYQIRRKEKDLA